ncbi:MAG: hypothetical protein ACP5DX_12150 [Paracoccaceae bacterium]
MRYALSVTYVTSLALTIVVGLRYDALSSGLAAPGPQGPFFCKELLSSGSDDDALVAAFGLFAIPLLLRAFRWNRGIAGFEVVAFGVCFGATCFALWLASLDCASIFYTAFVVPDPFLAGALIALPASAAALAWLRISQ